MMYDNSVIVIITYIHKYIYIYVYTRLKSRYQLAFRRHGTKPVVGEPGRFLLLDTYKVSEGRVGHLDVAVAASFGK